MNFDKLSKHYALDVDTKPWNAYFERPSMIKIIGSVRGKRILEAGSSAGWYAQTFLEMGALKYYGFDASESMNAYASKRLSSYKDWTISKWDMNKKIDSDIQNIDLIVSSLTMHYLKDWNNALASFNKILRKNGDLIISVHNPKKLPKLFPNQEANSNILLHDHWEINGEEIEVSFYGKTQKDMNKVFFNNGFETPEIILARPTLKFKELLPKSYKEQSKEPNFIILKTKKLFIY